MTDMTLPEPGADLTGTRCRTWGFWSTTIFGVISILVWVVAQTLAGLAVLKWLGTSLDAPDLELNIVTTHALTISIAIIASMPPAILVLFLAAWRARCSIKEYFALTWPARKDLVIGIAVVVVLLPSSTLTRPRARPATSSRLASRWW